MSKKIKLIYIASNGRSGSTLLDMLIGLHSKCFTLGEFQFLPIDYKYNTQPCGCNRRVDSCDFWGDIIKQNKNIIVNGTISRFRNFGFGKVIRWNELKEIYLNIPKSDCSLIKKYGRENFLVLKSVLEKVKKSNNVYYLIDASKDPYRLKWLAQSGYFDLSVLHIIKNPLAFVYSMTKKEKSFIKKMFMTFRMSVRWVIENMIIAKVADKFIGKKKYLKIKYEKLASDHIVQTQSIFNFLKIHDHSISNNKYQSNNHAINGNKMRHEKNSIFLDEKWRKEMGIFFKFICNITTILFRKIYN